MTERVATTYETGDWTAVAGSKTALLIDSPPGSKLLEDVWQLVRTGADHVDVIELLIGKIGLRQLPSFALVGVGDEEATVIVRGEAAAESAGAPDVVAVGVETWVERQVPSSAGDIRLTGGHLAGSPRMPLAGGIVAAGALVVQLADHRWAAPPPMTEAETRPEEDDARGSDVPAAVARVAPAESAAGSAVWGGRQDQPQPQPQPQPSVTAHASEETRTFLTTPGKIADGLGWTDSGQSQGNPQHAREEPGYDHLFGLTIDRTVEEAAIRVPEEPRDPPPTKSRTTDQPTPPAITTPPPPPASQVHASPSSSGPSAISAAGLIDSFPSWASPAPSATGSEQRAPAVPVPATSAVPAPNGSDVRSPVSTEVDERTTRRPPRSPSVVGPAVHAVVCPDQHPNPAQAANCRVCAKPVADQVPLTVPRPPLGVLRLSTGDLITLDRSVVIGRSPQPNRMVGDERPHIVKVSSKDISREHVEIKLDGWHVLVTDLGSTNGTWVALPGREPQRLRDREPLPIEPGTTVSLAEEVEFRFDVAP